MTRAAIAMGSNLGNRWQHLHAARQRLPVVAVSPIYETEPVECPQGSQPFLNGVVLVSWPGSLAELHTLTKQIEVDLGRDGKRGHHAPRPIDLDILAFGDETLSSAELVVPHPRLHERRFVIQPFADLCPEWILPGFTQTLAALRDQLVSDEPPLRLYTPMDHSLSLAEKLSAMAQLKPAGRKLSVLTAADYPTARLLDEAGLDIVLVGDSLGMVVLGYPDTVEVTLEEMKHHTRAVRRGVRRALIVSDLPYHTYQTPQQAVESARELVAAGADAVKLEGGLSMIAQVRAIVEAGIPLVGHIGMLPQSVREEGGYKKKGKTSLEAERLMQDALALDEMGALAIVLEGVVPAVAAEISRAIACPSIGIGSGRDCDGQVLVTHDLIGAFPWFRPPFAKAQADVAGEIRRAATTFLTQLHSS